MAKSGKYSRSVLEASDEIPDIYCEPCQQAGIVAIAEGYCVDCPEYLCGPCYRIHRRHKALASHVLLDKDSMPIATDSSKRVVDVCDEKCPIHPYKVIELFCGTCDKLVCHICVATDHRQCKDVKHIPDIVKDLEHTIEFLNLNDDIESTAYTLPEHEKKLKANVISISEMRTLAKQELQHHKAEVNKFFDQLEKKMDDQITTIEQRNQATLKVASDRLNHIKTDSDRIKNEIETTNTELKCKLFIAMKRCQKKMKNLQGQIDKLKRGLRTQHYKLIPSEQIQAMMITTTEICRIATARFESEIDIKISTDKKEPGINSLTVMHGRYCVALVSPNNSLRVIDTRRKCMTSQITIEAENIWVVTPVSDDQVAVSVSLSRVRQQMQFFTVSASGVIQKTDKLYDVNSWYRDMVHCSGNIYGVRHDRIDKLDMTGKIIRTIHKNKIGSLVGIAASPDGQTLYVTDDPKQSVTSMTVDGKLKTVYKDKDLQHPGSITVDKHGYVYVCSFYRNIQQFTADLNKFQDLIDVYSEKITYSSTENKLLLEAGNQIHLYSLEFK